MRRCAQVSQRSTCPPNAPTGRARGLKAHVRQRSIADMTLSWSRLTWPAWEARSSRPAMAEDVRHPRPTAVITAASTGHLPQDVERAGPNIGLLLQEMGGEAVPQRMNADTLGDAGTPGCQANDAMQLARTRMLPAVAGKQPGLSGRHPALLARNAPPLMNISSRMGERMTYRSFLPLPARPG